MKTRSSRRRLLLPLHAAVQIAIQSPVWSQPHDAHGNAHAESHGEHAPSTHDAHEAARGLLGPYPMSREASGTAWQPEAAPMAMLHASRGSWDLTYMGFVNVVYADAFAQGPLNADFRRQGRGDRETFAESMAMVTAQRAAGGGTLALRAMLSLDPATIDDDGYPLLLQTGETSDGVTPLIDHQHPHDFFMELSASFSRELGERRSAFVYAGLPGEPALGPAAFMHRGSGIDNPDAPLSHHWLDSTHITFGVVTGGLILGDFKIEASIFNGREPDHRRYDIETDNLDSWSIRASWNPSPRWAMQISHAALAEAELHHTIPLDVDRTTASVTHHRALAIGEWQSTLAIGRNDHGGGNETDAYLLESALTFKRDTTVFARWEQVDKDALFLPSSALFGRVFTVRKLGVGIVHDLRALWRGRFGVGAVYNQHFLPGVLDLFYGDDPDSWLVFARWKI